MDQNVVPIYNDKNIKLFSKDLVNIALETSQGTRKSKGHNLIFEMIISDLKGGLLFFTTVNSYPIISNDKV